MNQEELQQREENAKILEPLLNDVSLGSIAELIGPLSRDAILSWAKTGEGLSRIQRCVVGYVTHLASFDIEAGRRIESPDIYNDKLDCHWGHAGLRTGGIMRWYPITESTWSSIRSQMRDENKILTFRTQNDILVFASIDKLDEVALLDEASEWHNGQEWEDGGGYSASVASVDYWNLRFFWAADSEDLTEEIYDHFEKALGENSKDDVYYDRCHEATVYGIDASWKIAPSDASLEDLLLALETEDQPLFFENEDCTRIIPLSAFRIIEMPLARCDNLETEYE